MSLANPPVLVTDASPITLTIIGEPNAIAHYEVTASEGTLLMASGAVTLSGLGEGVASLVWFAPDTYQEASLTARTSYDPSLNPGNTKSTPVDVLRRFGDPNLPTVMSVAANTLVSIPIDLTSGNATMRAFGITGQGTGQLEFGLYLDDISSLRVLTLGMVAVPANLGVVEVPASMNVVSAGSYRLVFRTTALVNLATDNTDVGARITSGATLPDVFPSAQASALSWSATLTVGP